MITGSIARRYAKALFSLGVDQGNHEQLGRELGTLARAMKQSAELRETLTNPVFKRSQRKQVVDRVLSKMKASKPVHSFCQLLLDRERIAAVPDIARELDVMIDDRANRIVAEVASARPLTKPQQKQLQRTLEQISGRTVSMNEKHDPELLGGVVAKLGDVIYDGSLRTQLERMRTSLVK